MGLLALGVLDAFLAGAQGEGPVRAHLGVFVEGFERVVVEGVFLAVTAARGPDQRLMGIGKARALEVRHRVGLAPDDVVQDPEAQVLNGGPQAEHVMIAADHPDRAFGFQHPAAFLQPGTAKAVIGGKALELVPVVIDRIDLGVVGPQQVPAQLQIIGRVGKDHVHRRIGQRSQHLDAVAQMDDIGLQIGHGTGPASSTELSG